MSALALICLFGLHSPHAAGADKTVEFVPHTKYAGELRTKMLAFNKAFTASPALTETQASCPEAHRYIERVKERLIRASGLEAMVRQEDFPITVKIGCLDSKTPDAEMKAGVLEVSSGMLLLLAGEDEIAAVVAHELAHYTLAHDHQVLEQFHRLPPFALHRLEMKLEMDADAESLSLLANAGYDPYAALDSLQKVQEFMRERGMQTDERHPSLKERIGKLGARLRASFDRTPRSDDNVEAVKQELHGLLAHAEIAGPAMQ